MDPTWVLTVFVTAPTKQDAFFPPCRTKNIRVRGVCWLWLGVRGIAVFAGTCWAVGSLQLVCKCVESIKGDSAFPHIPIAGVRESGSSSQGK